MNPSAVDTEAEIRRFAWKAEAGADFAVTQPSFDPDEFTSFAKRIEAFGVPLIAGLWPPLSIENAEFLANEVPGVRVPGPVLDRMRRASETGELAAAEEGVAVAREVLGEIGGAAVGALVSAPSGRVERAVKVLEA